MPSHRVPSCLKSCNTGCLVEPISVFDPSFCDATVPPMPQPDNGEPEWSTWPKICISLDVPCCALPSLYECLKCDVCESDSSCHECSSICESTYHSSICENSHHSSEHESSHHSSEHENSHHSSEHENSQPSRRPRRERRERRNRH